ncbi:hypothetical protein S40288_11505 [Stachybotrys chartarum IBT 40288]|nr:hypothetical protein S40288_11505 [Stachybotrys chartarum IBT 40288]
MEQGDDHPIQMSKHLDHMSNAPLISLDMGFTTSTAAVYDPRAVVNSRPQLRIVYKFPTELLVTTPCDGAGRATFEFVSPANESHVPLGSVGDANQRRLKYLKTLLMDRELRTITNTRAREHVSNAIKGFRLPTRPKNAVAIFISGLWKEALTRLPSENNSSAGNTSQKPHAVITYPGNWNEEELNQLEKAVEQANIKADTCPYCPISYCTEQEAALHAVLVDHEETLHAVRNEGGTILVVDCGGLTADAATYTFHKPQEMGSKSSPGEVGRVDSCFFGGTTLDTAFDDQMVKYSRGVLGRIDDEFACEIRADRDNFLERWETIIKPTFSGDNGYNEDLSFRLANKQKCIVIRRLNPSNYSIFN